jgi:cytochrome c-type biogenesis protein CcmH/NrfG
MTPNQMEIIRKWIRVEILYQSTLTEMSRKLDNPADPMNQEDFEKFKEELKEKLKVDSFYNLATQALCS